MTFTKKQHKENEAANKKQNEIFAKEIPRVEELNKEKKSCVVQVIGMILLLIVIVLWLNQTT